MPLDWSPHPAIPALTKTEMLRMTPERILAYWERREEAIKLEKEDFAGKPELVWQSERGATVHLVAVQPEDPTIVPPEASQIVAGSTIVGRITSSRMSPTLERSICLAQVDASLSEPGTRLVIHLPDGTDVGARVMEHHAHVDPEGVRLRG